MKFYENDCVYISEEFAFGIIVEIKDNIAYVEFTTSGGGGCLPFEFEELKPVWCISSDNNGKINYLAYDISDNYIWMSKDNLKEVIYNNLKHQFLFTSRKSAIKYLKSCNITQKCKVVMI